MNAAMQLLKFTGIDFGIFCDFPQAGLPGMCFTAGCHSALLLQQIRAVTYAAV
jgi:hypothetical protein